MKKMVILQWTHQDPISPWCDFRWVRPIRSPVVYAPQGVVHSTRKDDIGCFNQNKTVWSRLIPYMDSGWWISQFKPHFNTSQAKLITRRNENEWIPIYLTLILIGPECQNPHLGDFPVITPAVCRLPEQIPCREVLKAKVGCDAGAPQSITNLTVWEPRMVVFSRYLPSPKSKSTRFCPWKMNRKRCFLFWNGEPFQVLPWRVRPNITKYCPCHET